MVYTGANFLVAKLETDGTTLTPVGVGVKVGTFEHNYNVDRAYGIGDRIADVMYSKGFEGSLSFDAILDDNTSPFVAQWINSGAIDEIDLYLVKLDGSVLSTDVDVSEAWKLIGYKPDGVKITARAGEYVGLSFDGKFRKSEYLTGQTLTLSIAPLTNTPLIFASANVNASSWSIDLNVTKEFEIDVKHNIETLKVLNDLYPAVLQEQKYEIDATLNVYVNATTWSELTSALSENAHYKNDMYPDTTLTLTVTGVNKTYTFTLSNVALSSFSTSFEDANVVEGSLKLMAKNITLS